MVIAVITIMMRGSMKIAMHVKLARTWIVFALMAMVAMVATRSMMPVNTIFAITGMMSGINNLKNTSRCRCQDLGSRKRSRRLLCWTPLPPRALVTLGQRREGLGDICVDMLLRGFEESC
eukprot:906999-Rhodomonas_salina.1